MQKFTADYIHDGRKLVKDHALIVDDEGRILEMLPVNEAGEEIQYFPGLLCPGFVNTHCHFELSHLKNLFPTHTGLTDFLITVIQHRNDFSSSIIKEAAEKAEQEMLKNGIVAVGDISNNTDSLEIKQNKNLYYHTFVESIGLADADASNRMEYAQKVYKCFKENDLRASIVPHAPYSVSRSLFEMINDFGKDKLISIHNQESEAENLLYKGKDSDLYRLYQTLHLDHSSFQPTGRSSLQSWLPIFTNKQPIILVHNTFISESDIQFALQTDHSLYWCLCPKANLYIENKLPPVNLLVKNNAAITLGTDSLASNNSLSILEEMKTLQHHFPKINTENLIQWATLNGAKALNYNNELGSFEKGKKPGIIWIKNMDLEDNEIRLGMEVEVEVIKR